MVWGKGCVQEWHQTCRSSAWCRAVRAPSCPHPPGFPGVRAVSGWLLQLKSCFSVYFEFVCRGRLAQRMAVLCTRLGLKLRSHLRWGGLDGRTVGYGFVGGCCPGGSTSRWLQVTPVLQLRHRGSPGACTTSLAFFQSVMNGGPGLPPLPQLYCRSLSAACRGCFRRPPGTTTSVITPTCPEPQGAMTGWVLPCAGCRSSSLVLQPHPTGERRQHQSPSALGRRWGC